RDSSVTGVQTCALPIYALGDLLAYSRRLVDIRTTQGIDAAVKTESSGEGFTKINKVLADLNLFIETEHSLLTHRSATVEANFHNITRVLVCGSLMSAGLLLLANSSAGREKRRRDQAEREQLALTTQLSRTTALQKAILSSANYAIISTNTKGIVTTFNAAAERWLGYQASEVVGKGSSTLWHDRSELEARARALSDELGTDIEPGFETLVAKARLMIADENEWTFVRKDGKRFPVSLSVTAMVDNLDNTTGFLSVV